MNISIRPEHQADIEEIHELNQVVFGQDNEAKLIDMVREGPDFIPELSLVAVEEDKIVGYILFTRVTIANGENRHTTLGLASLIVNPLYQKKGIGAKLVTHGLQKATELSFTSVLALGYEYYFPKFGFLPTSRWNIKPPFEVPSEVFMALELVPNALSNISGVVEFPLEFSVM